ncbi:MFS transporter [Rhizobium sp. VS19-DR104.2]|uniref:MFS transporter n=1 Tax=unclassified Rhizobium TaxID=2613769 RepID=UPI001CC5A0A3|nr:MULTISPECIES: MFS transporter [unclassified Rhizobium]MBZ5763721.1 MFS transporter [Rhizobium sp. VS19-DR96]MBZ5769652.1 MFS transporter [Rhizobium sp. VS19-DR129.2]MBZ5777187.1 MFS transporter [Rhizobium sp. VS19-DRK62.2]MBZ5788333.1 MFS transporter [Rhizobium sp. VS19-DR121]MBZ5805788.1 MFS transporter [Rhizobium sp. VS19-DR181]
MRRVIALSCKKFSSEPGGALDCVKAREVELTIPDWWENLTSDIAIIAGPLVTKQRRPEFAVTRSAGKPDRHHHRILRLLRLRDGCRPRFPELFFPTSDPTTGVLQSFATFSIAFFARPIGAIVFGHFGDRSGRKVTLVAALMTMGISTLLIGFLPSYASIGVPARSVLPFPWSKS